MVALVETWLKGEEEIVVEGYLYRRAVRGFGGLLVCEEVLERYTVCMGPLMSRPLTRF